MKILFVDDEEDLREYFGEWLEMKGYGDILTAGTGQEALEIIAQEKPELILLDISLGDASLDGMEVLKRTKQDLSPQSSVVMVSGHRDLHYDASIQNGAIDFLKKPITYEALEQKLGEILKLIEKLT